MKYALRNHLEEILKERNITQKELAETVGERPNNIGDFINLKRSTVNIELLIKIASYLKISKIEEILSFVEVFRDDRFSPFEWYKLSLEKYGQEAGTIRFSFSYQNNKETFVVMEVTSEGLFVSSKYVLTGRNAEEIELSFHELGLKGVPSGLDDEDIYKLVQVCRYSPDHVDTKRYKSKDEARGIMETIEENYFLS